MQVSQKKAQDDDIDKNQSGKVVGVYNGLHIESKAKGLGKQTVVNGNKTYLPGISGIIYDAKSPSKEVQRRTSQKYI